MMKKILAILTAIVLAVLTAGAQHVLRKDSVAAARLAALADQKVVVHGDTVSMVIPERNFGRFDRGLFNFLYVPKGYWAVGLSASYGQLDTEDSRILNIVNDIDLKGKMYSIKPSISYFFRDNQSVGLMMNYSRGEADLKNFAVDIDEDMNFAIHDVSYYTETYEMAVSYRNYVGLSADKRFAVFNEVDLQVGSGSSRFKRYYDDALKDTRTSVTKASLNFSPGVCVFIQDFVAINVSFGIFGVNMRREHQTTNGVDEGSRFASGANFKFNIFNINFGMMVII